MGAGQIVLAADSCRPGTDVRGSLAAAHYCGGPWPSNHTRRTRQTAPTTARGPVPGATSAARHRAAQDRAGDDAAYRAAVVDLLGVLAYGELTAFSRLAADADLAPTQPTRRRSRVWRWRSSATTRR